jgi:hypothetical protein
MERSLHRPPGRLRVGLEGRFRPPGRNSLDLDLPIWTLPTRERPRMAAIAVAVSLIALVVVALSVSAA